jgi:hypothetical protein
MGLERKDFVPSGGLGFYLENYQRKVFFKNKIKYGKYV